MAIDIPSLFRDVIETPEQRQRRKLSEAVALAPQARGGIASLLNPLAQAASINLQQGSEGLGRSVGGMLGLDMRDTGEKVSDELLGADLSDATGMRDLSKAISPYAPVQAMGLLQAADEKDLQEAQLQRDLDDRTQLRTLREQNIAANTQNVELETQNKAARKRIAENLREEGEVSENLIDSYERGVTTIAQIENAIRAGKSDDIRDAQEGRAKELFENRMTEWTQSQEDRESQEIGANAFKSTLLAQVKQSNETSDEDSVYTSLLESDANIPVNVLNQIKTNIENDAEPNVTFQSIFYNGKNVIAAIDRDTFEITPIADSRATPVSPRDIPLLNADTSGQIKSQIDSYPAWEEQNLFAKLGGGKATAGESLLVDIVHSYSQSQNVPQAQVLAMIDNQIQSDLGLEALKTGVLLPSSSMSLLVAPEGVTQEDWDAFSDEQKQEFMEDQ